MPPEALGSESSPALREAATSVSVKLLGLRSVRSALAAEDNSMARNNKICFGLSPIRFVASDPESGICGLPGAPIAVTD